MCMYMYVYICHICTYVQLFVYLLTLNGLHSSQLNLQELPATDKRRSARLEAAACEEITSAGLGRASSALLLRSSIEIIVIRIFSK